MERNKHKAKTIIWKLFKIISFKLSEGKKPPFDTKVIVRFKELKSLTPDRFKEIK